MRSTTVGWMLLALAACAPQVAAGAIDETPVSGVWQKREYQLSYMGITSNYSCDGIEYKVKLLLRAASARDDVKVQANCSDPFGRPSKITSAHATFYVLVPQAAAPPAPPAPPPAPADRQLGRPAPELKAAAPEAGVGAWQAVEFADRKPYGLEAGDCELVEQFDRELLPLLTTRNHVSHLTCVPHQQTLGGIQVRFETLAPLPKADPGRAATPR